MGYWSIILPEAGTNKVNNPIAMGSSYYYAFGTSGVAQRVSTYSYLGYKCYLLTSTDDDSGWYVSTDTLANAIHYVTLRVRTNSTCPNNPYVSLDVGAHWTITTLLGTEGDWYIYGAQISAAYSSGGLACYLSMLSEDDSILYLGHIQVEQNTYPTTPITGDLKCFSSNGYYWNGAAHASSSTRSASTGPTRCSCTIPTA